MCRAGHHGIRWYSAPLDDDGPWDIFSTRHGARYARKRHRNHFAESGIKPTACIRIRKKRILREQTAARSVVNAMG